MNRKKAYTILGISLTAFAVWGAFRIRKNRQDKRAVNFMGKLEILCDPTGKSLDISNAFDINYWKGKGGLLSTAVAKSKAADIENAFGFFNDNEEEIYAVFRSLTNKAQVSQVSAEFYSAYKVNLIDRLRNRLSDGELKVVTDIVNRLT